MTRSPDRDDRAVIVRLAEQEVSIRRIAKITKWSRPTIKKVLDSAGFDPSTKRIATGSPTGGVADSAPTVDYEASMKQADADARALSERWLLGEDLPTYGLPRGVGQVDQ